MPLPTPLAGDTFTVTATPSTGVVATDTGRLREVTQWWDSAERAIVVDGSLDDLSGIPQLDFAADGVLKIADHRGAEDLSATMWVTWDETNFHLSAEVIDDVHYAPLGGQQMWSGDSIQFAIGAGAPGESLPWSEFGIALTPQGSEITRWMADGFPTGDVPEATVSISRDDATGTSTYEVAIPWSVIDAQIPADGMYALSALVNENDGTGRRGTYEWGEGISSAKDSGLFRAIRLVAAPDEPTPTPTPSGKPFNPNRPEKPENPNRPMVKPDKPGKPDKPDKPGKPGKPKPTPSPTVEATVQPSPSA